MRRKNQIRKLIPVLILLLACVFLYSAVRFVEFAIMSRRLEEVKAAPSKTLVRDGVEYFPRQDIDVFLLMGIDREGSVPPQETRWYSDRADTVVLLVFDQKDETARVLSLNRDTMLDMPELDTNGRRTGTYHGQLGFAYYFGDGLQISCENTKKTVSDFLYGINIDHYVAMTLDGISVLNDAVGGVTVTVTDDFSAIYADLPMGEVTLNGEQAVAYVRGRRGVGDHLNVSRMARQETYIKSFVDAFRVKQETNSQFALQAYDAVSDYIVTDCSGTVLSSALERYADYKLVEMVTPKGDNVEGKQYMEFYVDEEALDALILRLFYTPK